MPDLSRKLALASTVGACAALLTGCAVGPDYLGPPLEAVHYKQTEPFQRAAVAQASAAPPPARWWEALKDPVLTRLIDDALASSPTLREARANVRAARAEVGVDESRLLPAGGAGGLALSARAPGDTGVAFGGPPSASARHFTLYSTGFDALWEVDLFGGARREVEGAQARAEGQQARLEDAQVQLAADVARAYVELRDAQISLELTREAIGVEMRTLDAVNQLRGRGAAGDEEVARVTVDLEHTKSEVAPIAARLSVARDQLAILTGRRPGALEPELAGSAPPPVPPKDTPVGDPTSLLRRRPDIRAAERALAASHAEIGAHVADLFPKVSLLGSLGFSGTGTDRLLESSHFAAIGGPSISWGLFDYPRIHAQIRGARAQTDAASAHYEAVVLAALQDAESALTNYGRQRESLSSLAAAEAAAVRADALAQQRYAAGAGTLTDLLDADRNLIAARQQIARGRALLTLDYIVVQKSLGLGWGAGDERR